MRKLLLAGAAVAALAVLPFETALADASDAEINTIVDEGLSHSQAMLAASELMDGIGPRLTNSENMERAQAWAEAKFAAYGLTAIHRESFDFGVGWDLAGSSARMISPRPIEMRMLPVAWSPPTSGAARAPVIVAPMSRVEHFEAWRGKLAGKIVLVSMPGTTSESAKPDFQRLEDKDIAEYDAYDFPRDPDETAITRRYDASQFPRRLSQFLKAEGAVAIVKKSYRDNGLLHGEGYLFQPGEGLELPYVELGAEDYRRLVRLEKSGTPPVIELSVDAAYDTQDLQAENVFADIRGADPRAGYVMAGAHFDSWIAADGAADNGAGSIVVLEAARILAKMPKPKRTIRFALWSGEEQGLLGSLAYVEQHLASRPIDPSYTGMMRYYGWREGYPITVKPGHAELKAYFNLDNGGGRIRGIYAENNIGAIPVLKKWLSPFASMDAGAVVAKRTGGTDHVFMQAVGLPAFQFIQDPLDYGTRTHHSSVDTLDHMRPDDLRQAATIMAAMLWQAANSDAALPRPPLPTEPSKSDPFTVTDPDAR